MIAGLPPDLKLLCYGCASIKSVAELKACPECGATMCPDCWVRVGKCWYCGKAPDSEKPAEEPVQRRIERTVSAKQVLSQYGLQPKVDENSGNNSIKPRASQIHDAQMEQPGSTASQAETES